MSSSGHGGVSGSLSLVNCIRPPNRKYGVRSRHGVRRRTCLMSGLKPRASARPTHWLIIPALPSVTTQQEDGAIALASSEAKHVVQAEGAWADETVIAEQAAGHIAHD